MKGIYVEYAARLSIPAERSSIDAAVVDDNIDSTEIFDRTSSRGYRVRIGHVNPQYTGRHRSEFFGTIGVANATEDRVPGAGEVTRQSQTESSTGSGDHDSAGWRCVLSAH